jgi:hypothetical protein
VLKGDIETVAQKRQTKRISGTIGNAIRLKPNAFQIRRRQIDRAIFSGHRANPLCSQK